MLQQPDGIYWLISADEQQVGSVKLSANAALLVGRAAHNHLVLNDYRISRQHARVTHERDGFYVYDLNSVNGTLVNGAKIRRHKLSRGDTVTLGPFVFTFDERAESSRSPSTVNPVIWQPGESITRFTDAPIRLQDSHSPFKLPAAAPARPNFDLNSLEHAHKNLGILYEFVQAIGQTIEKHELLELMGGKILETFPIAASVCVYLRSNDETEFALAHFVGSAEPIELRPEITRAVITAGCAVPNPMQKSSRTPSAMFAPMMDRGAALGIICVKAGGKEGFTPSDIDLLSGMAVSATIALKNTYHHEQSLQQERIRRDLELAAQIQVSFLPREVISVQGVDFLASYRAAYTVGGDFYDIFWVGPTKLACFIGDISGKGVAAALLMARITGELRIAALAHIDPLHVLSIMNRAVLDRGQPELFFTAAYLTLDVVSGEVLLACGGHPTPFLCRANGDVAPLLEEGSTAVGMFEDPSFAAKRFHLDDRDSIVLYTDGVIEARDNSGDLFGTERLYDCLSGIGSFPDDISAALLRNVEQFAGPADASDDLTIFICHRCVGAPAAMQPRSRTTADVARAFQETYEMTSQRDGTGPSPLVDPRLVSDTILRRPAR